MARHLWAPPLLFGVFSEFEVVEEPKTGLFGRTRGEARVRARVRPTQPRPKVERRDRRGKSSGRSGKPGERRGRDGRGGGRPDLAEAGGKDASGLATALAGVPDLVRTLASAS